MLLLLQGAKHAFFKMTVQVLITEEQLWTLVLSNRVLNFLSWTKV